MKFRHAGQYPPYTFLIALTIQGRKDDVVLNQAMAIKDEIVGNFKTIGIISLLKIQDLYRYRILLKGKDLDSMRHSVARFLSTTKIDVTGLRIDINPMYLD